MSDIDVTWMNGVSFVVLALAGAALFMALRRIVRVIRAAERKVSRTTQEKEKLAQILRKMRKEGQTLREAIEEADYAISQMTTATGLIESRIERLKGQERQRLTMADRAWSKGDQLWWAHVSNPTLGGAHWGEGIAFHGFARSADDFQARLATLYPARDGFIVAAAQMMDLMAGGRPAVAASVSAKEKVAGV
jgi:hypothetical protein